MTDHTFTDTTCDPLELEFTDEEPSLDALKEEVLIEDAVPEAHLEQTGETNSTITIYLRELQKTPLLTAEQEKELAVKVAAGDQQARNRMIETNLRLVVTIAKRYINRGFPFADLVAEGNLGLIKAVERFDLDKECRFSTYATWWIRQAIERSLVNQSRTIRLPVHIAEDVSRMYRIMRQLSQALQRPPTPEEIGAEMGMKTTHVRRLLTAARYTCSIEAPVGSHDGNSYSLMDTIEDQSGLSPAEQTMQVENFKEIIRHFDLLSETEQRILTLRYGLNDQEPQTLDVIGQEFGVTRERIRQIEGKSLEKLRQAVHRGATTITSSPVKRKRKTVDRT